MTTTQEEKAKAWDFSAVFNLKDTLSTADSTHSTPRSSAPPLLRTVTSPVHERKPPKELNGHKTTLQNGLGDFSQIWNFLGSPLDAPAPKIPPAIDTSPTLRQRIPGKTDYTSDGGVYPGLARSKPKSIQWRDETDGGDLTDIAPSKSDEEADEELLTKKQRYKRRKKERQRLEKAEAARRAASDLESEAEPQKTRNGPARKASQHNISRQASPSINYNLGERDTTGLVVAAHGTPKPEKRTTNLSLQQTKTTAPLPEKTSTSKPPQPLATPTGPKYASNSVQAAIAAVAAVQQRQQQATKGSPVPKTISAHAKSFLPSTVQPSPKSAAKPLADSIHAVLPTATPPTHTIQQQTPSKPSRYAIEPKIVRPGADRDWALLLKLIADFYEDRAGLVRPSNFLNHGSDPRGIHVFVDASNIFIGFHDQLKRARNIPQHFHIPQANMSFDSLALLMERRRPVAKRVLAGSTPHVPAFDVAKAVGYECNILDKVYKARELTERQRYFAEAEQRSGKGGKRNSFHASGYTSGGGGGSGSETTTAVPTHAPEKFVEQGVDEIIHLKILESVVDVDEPTTIVLATGDAAQAEYSQGFMAMCERALKRGWKVELVSWSKNISQMYRRREFVEKYKDSFRIILLDDYAEELLDM